MSKYKKEMSALSIFGLIFLLAVALSAAEPVPVEVLNAAEEGLNRYLDAIPDGQLDHFGFTSKEEFALTTVGTPFRVYTIKPAELFSFNEGDDISSVISPTTLWMVPVICAGSSRALLKVDLMNGEWKAVGIGASVLASEMERVEDFLIRFSGYETKFVRIYQASKDLILLSKGGVSHFVPLRSTDYDLGPLKQGEVYEYRLIDPSEIITRLVPVVEKNLEIFHGK